jgi:branched-chain amino acid transport system ATP-binding protein
METQKEALLVVNKLEVVYFHVSTAIQGVSFQISEGQVFALIGANGAGKTTTLRTISGFLGSDNAYITDGEVRFMGERLNGLSPYKITSRGIALVPERNKVFETLTTEENLAVSISRAGTQKEMERKTYEYFPKLHERRKHLAGLLSGGERQMLAMGQALLCSPKLLLVDELSLGLAPILVTHLVNTLMQIKQDFGLTILMVEQNAVVALNTADYAAVMENGRIVFDGTPERLLSHQDVREFYLGLHETGEKSYRDVKQYRRSRRWWG